MKTKASPLVSPCLESTRCYLTCASRDVRLSCNASAKVGTQKDLSDSCINEEWSIIPMEDGLVALYSLKSKRYLSAGAGDAHGSRDGKCHIAAVEGCDSDQQRWKVEPSSAEKGGIHLLSAARKSKLACNEDGELYLSENIYEGLGETWRIEFLSGELCYISSQNSHHDVRVRCDPTGIFDVSDNWKGWEVFRFIEAGDGSVYISSWTHSKYFLSSNSDGRVAARKKRTADEKWLVKKSKDQPGVLIISQQHGKALATNGKGLITMDPFDILASGDGGDVDDGGSKKKSFSGLWDLVAGNRNTFFIASNSSGKCIGSSPCKKAGPSDAIMVNKRKAWQQWTLSETDDGSITLKSNSHNLYIGVDKSNKVTLNENPGPNEMWSLEESPHGGIYLISDEHRVCLSCSESGVLGAVSGKNGAEETWTLVPSMPSSLSGPVIGTMVGLGLATAAFACAAPFMVTGAVATLGFGEAGIVGGSTAAAMMSAEAMAASTGGVAAGGLVATCQSIGAAGLGFVGTSTAIAGGALVGGTLSAATVAGISNASKKKSDQTADEKNKKEGVDCLAPTTNRPFCAWRTW